MYVRKYGSLDEKRNWNRYDFVSTSVYIPPSFHSMLLPLQLESGKFSYLRPSKRRVRVKNGFRKESITSTNGSIWIHVWVIIAVIIFAWFFVLPWPFHWFDLYKSNIMNTEADSKSELLKPCFPIFKWSLNIHYL